MAHSLLDTSQGRRTHGLELPPPCQIEEGEVHGEVHIEWDRSSLSFVDRAKQLGGNTGGKKSAGGSDVCQEQQAREDSSLYRV